MKHLFLALIGVFALAVQTVNADIISFDLANAANASIRFTGTGDKIEFPNTSMYDFVITDATSPNLGGLQGNIDGIFIVGTITTPAIGMEEASVTTTDGTFSVYDGVGATLTADLDWTDIYVFGKLMGGMNTTGVVNLSNVTYSGGNSDLMAIANGREQTVVLTFQFSPVTKKSLTELMADGRVTTTSYSGSLSSVPEPSSCLLLATAGLGLLCCDWRRRAS